MSVPLPLSLPKNPLMNCLPILSQTLSLSLPYMSVPFHSKNLIFNCLHVQFQSLKCLSVQFPSMSLFLNCLTWQFLSLNGLLQSMSMPQIFSYLSVLFQPMPLIMNCLLVQLQSMSLIMICFPAKLSTGRLSVNL